METRHQTLTSHVMIKPAGLGRHLVSQTAATAVRFEKINVSVQFIYPVSITLPKLAILCLYRRAFITRSYRYAIISTATILCLNWLAGLVMAIFLCHPFGYLRMQMDSYP